MTTVVSVVRLLDASVITLMAWSATHASKSARPRFSRLMLSKTSATVNCPWSITWLKWPLSVTITSWWRVGQEVATWLVHAMVMSRLDYCNAVLASLPQTTLALLQQVQNSAARLIFELRTVFATVAPVTTCWRVQIKLCCIVHKSSIGRVQHIRWTLSTLSVPAEHIPASEQCRQRTSHCHGWALFGERAFSQAGPTTWNALLEDVGAMEDLAMFRKQLKVHYFLLAFNAITSNVWLSCFMDCCNIHFVIGAADGKDDDVHNND